MSKVNLNYGPIESSLLPSLDTVIDCLNQVINNLQRSSIPGDFYRKNTLYNTISDLKGQRDKLSNIRSWIVDSNRNYDSMIDKLGMQAYKLPVYTVERRKTII